MPIHIVKASDPIVIEHIIMGIYSLPGIGKTSLGQTCKRPLTLNADMGIHRARNRKDSVSITNWRDVEDLTEEDLEDYDTLVVDTVGRLLDVMSAKIISDNPKNSRGNAGLSLQGFGVLRVMFTQWLNRMRSYGKDIVLVSHMDEKVEGDITKERLDVQGGSKAEIYKVCDAMAKLYVDGKEKKLDFSPREGSLGKNPAQLEILTVPNFTKHPDFLGEVIDQIKAAINSRTAEQTAAAAHIDEWRKKIEALDNDEKVNAMLAEVKNEVPEVKMLLNLHAEQHGLSYDKKAGKYIETAA